MYGTFSDVFLNKINKEKLIELNGSLSDMKPNQSQLVTDLDEMGLI